VRTIRTPAVAVRASAAGRVPTFTMVAYTGEPMKLDGFPAPVVVDLQTADLTGTPFPALHDHVAAAASVVGVVDRLAVVNRQLVAAGRLTPTPTNAADEVIRLAEQGFAWQASVGCNAARTDEVRPGEVGVANWGRQYPGPVLIGRGCTFRELSFVVLGGDRLTSVLIAAKAAEGAQMDEEFLSWLRSLGLDPEALTDEQKVKFRELWDLVPDPEPESVGDQVSAHAAAVDILATHGVPKDVMVRAVREGWSANRCRAAALDHVRESRPKIAAAHGGGPGGAPEMDRLSAGLLIKAGYARAAEKAFAPQVVQAARPLARMHLKEFVAPAARAAGADIQAHGVVSTASFSSLLSNAANKVLEAAWQEAPATWRAFAAVKTAADFKPHTSVRPTFSGNLYPVGPGGEVKHGTLGDHAIGWQIYQFAKQFGIDRTQVVNDDLGALSEAIPSFSRAAARTLSDLVYATLLANAGSFFSGGNGNLLSGAGSALSVTSLSAAVTLMRRQRGPEGGFLDLSPVTLVVPPELESTAREVLQSAWLIRDQTADRQTTYNAMANLAELAVEPRLTGVVNPLTGQLVGGSATAWYLFASPADLPMLVGFLDGREAPQTYTIDETQNAVSLVSIVRAVADYGAAVGDFRAAVKSAGA
jgi:hypothetical protein